MITIKSPCRACEHLARDKDDPGCVRCIDRLRYCQIMGDNLPITDGQIRRNVRKMETITGEDMDELTCSTCGQTKQASTQFYRDYKKKNGYQAECKACHDKRSRENKAKRKAAMSEKQAIAEIKRFDEKHVQSKDESATEKAACFTTYGRKVSIYGN